MGHALEFVRADAIVRFKKLTGHDVFFNTGADEHGIKIFTKATEAGLTPQAFVNKGFETFKEQVSRFGISPDVHYIRTTDAKHIAAAEAFWQRVAENGYIYKKTYQAKYCVGCESEKTDSELVDGFCPEHPGIELSLINEENYFFKYSAFGEKLLAFYKANPAFIIPEFRYNEMKAFVERGLQDFSISRLKVKMPWGIPVPGDSDHVMYVWFDALVNYIATVGWGTDMELFNRYWVEGTPIQYCGKDNTRFQGIMWQAMLMAANVPNSHQIVVNGFITGDGGVRMSKTLGNVIDPRDIVAEYGTDALRFYLLAEVSSFEDSPFTKERFHALYNAKLANGIGNLTSRLMKMATTYLDTAVAVDSAISFSPEYIDDLNRFEIAEACALIWREITECDEQIQRTEPFKLIKTDKEKAEVIIRDLVMRLYAIGTMLLPILPETAQSIRTCVENHSMPETALFLRK